MNSILMVINNPSNINLPTLYLMTKENINAYVSDLRRSNMAIFNCLTYLTISEVKL